MRDSWLSSTLRSRSGLLQWFSILASVGVVVWILMTRGEQLRTVFSLTPAIFVLISISAILTFFLNGIELRVLAGRFDSHIPLLDAMLLGLMVSTLNYLPLKTGTMLNGLMLKTRYRLTLGHFAALVAGSSVVHLWTALVLAGAALTVGGKVSLGLALALVPTALLVALMVWGRLRSAGKHEGHESRIVRLAGRVVDGLGLIFASPKLLLVETAVNASLILLATLRTLWSFNALSAGIGFGGSLVVTSIGIFAARLSVIPGGVGFKEGGAAAGAAMAGIDPGLGLAASVIDRAVTLVWLLLLGVPATLYLQRMTGVRLADANRLSGEAGQSGGDE